MKNGYQPLIVALFLAMGMLVVGSRSTPAPNTVQVRGTLNTQLEAPELIGIAQGAEITDSIAVTQNANVPTAIGQSPVGPAEVAAATIQDPGQPVGVILDPTQEITYVVQRGDTLSSIASHFSISVASILSANPSIHKKVVQVGTSITIPGVNIPTGNSGLPNFNSDFVIPAQGYNYGVLDNNNGINIVNSCGTPVVAAADGIVVPDPNTSDAPGGWNGGYGNFVLIQHAFGDAVRTRYAHLEQASVQVGDYVKQGQQIGVMGQTGGASSCQLDFEVIGAQNPFAK